LDLAVAVPPLPEAPLRQSERASREAVNVQFASHLKLYRMLLINILETDFAREMPAGQPDNVRREPAALP
jgi:hypothetical protein